MTSPPDLPITLCAHCRRRLARAERLLGALSDGNPRTSLDLAGRLFGPDAGGQNVQPILCDLERAGAIVRDGQVWTDGYKHRVWLWMIAPASVREPEPEPEPKPEPPAAPNPPPKLEKGITQEEYEAHLRQGREIAERKAAKRAWRGSR